MSDHHEFQVEGSCGHTFQNCPKRLANDPVKDGFKKKRGEKGEDHVKKNKKFDAKSKFDKPKRTRRARSTEDSGSDSDSGSDDGSDSDPDGNDSDEEDSEEEAIMALVKRESSKKLVGKQPRGCRQVRICSIDRARRGFKNPKSLACVDTGAMETCVKMEKEL